MLLLLCLQKLQGGGSDGGWEKSVFASFFGWPENSECVKKACVLLLLLFCGFVCVFCFIFYSLFVILFVRLFCNFGGFILLLLFVFCFLLLFCFLAFYNTSFCLLPDTRLRAFKNAFVVGTVNREFTVTAFHCSLKKSTHRK